MKSPSPSFGRPHCVRKASCDDFLGTFQKPACSAARTPRFPFWWALESEGDVLDVLRTVDELKEKKLRSTVRQSQHSLTDVETTAVWPNTNDINDMLKEKNRCATSIFFLRHAN